MSYLKFRSLKYIYRTDAECLLLAWPVLSVPIRCWAISANALDAMERAVLALAGTGVRDPGNLQSLLGIPDSMATMIERTIRQLQTRGLLTHQIGVTESGWDVLKVEATLKEFQPGWLIFDLVRGKMFPFVHLSRRMFFRREEIEAFGPVTIPPQVSVPNRARLAYEGSLAVAAHNRRRALFEMLEDDYGSADENELELDSPVEVRYTAGVEDLELLSSELIESHHLLIEVMADLQPGSTQVLLQSYSPFSYWEQRQYLEALEGIPASPAKSALSELKARVRDEAANGLLPSGLGIDNPYPMLTQHMAEMLGHRPSLPDEVLDQLTAYEYSYQVVVVAAESSVPVRRELAVGQWGQFLEATLKRIASEIDTWPIPLDWRGLKSKTRDEIVTWYQQQVKYWKRPASWLNLPRLIDNAIYKIVKYAPPEFKDFTCSSSRDQLAKIILATLSVPASQLTPTVANLAAAIDYDTDLLAQLDEVVDWRNDSAHGGDKINQRTPDEFMAVLDQTRNAVYSFLRQTYAS